MAMKAYFSVAIETLYIHLTQQLVFGFFEHDYSAEVFYGDLAVPIYEIFQPLLIQTGK